MRKALYIAGLVVVVAIAGAYAWRRHASAPAEGRRPPILSAPLPQFNGLPVGHVGTFGYGLPAISNHSTRRAVLDSVALVQPTAGLKTKAIYVYKLRAGVPGYQGWRHWPPTASVAKLLQSVPGFHIPAHAPWDADFVFMLNVPHSGVYRSPGVRITYHDSNGQRYTLFDPLSLAVCTSKTCHVS